MGRLRRPYLPGCIFHLTARTVRREHWFTPGIRTKVLEALVDIVPRSRVRLLAVAVMSNHLHLVVQQGARPLAALMQPLLRRVAGHVQHTHALEGPVFWRHYASTPCLDPSHARNAIAYTHLNPVNAQLCDDPAKYRWTSHLLYTGPSVGPTSRALWRLRSVLDPSLALPLFAASPIRSMDQLRADYRGFMDARFTNLGGDLVDPNATVADDVDPGAHVAADDSAPPPTAPDWHPPAWGSALSASFRANGPASSISGDDGAAPQPVDLATLARRTLAAEAPGTDLDEIRGRGGGRRRTQLRHLAIRRLHAAGHSNVSIADFLVISPSAVSYVIRKGNNGRSSSA